jgi:hypothetical protein
MLGKGGQGDLFPTARMAAGKPAFARGARGRHSAPFLTLFPGQAAGPGPPSSRQGCPPARCPRFAGLGPAADKDRQRGDPPALTWRERARDYRDGPMIALLTLRPPRLANLARLELRRDLVDRGGGAGTSAWWLEIPASTKTGASIELPFLPSCCRRWRPILPSGGRGSPGPTSSPATRRCGRPRGEATGSATSTSTASSSPAPGRPLASRSTRTCSATPRPPPSPCTTRSR